MGLSASFQVLELLLIVFNMRCWPKAHRGMAADDGAITAGAPTEGRLFLLRTGLELACSCHSQLVTAPLVEADYSVAVDMDNREPHTAATFDWQYLIEILARSGLQVFSLCYLAGPRMIAFFSKVRRSMHAMLVQYLHIAIYLV